MPKVKVDIFIPIGACACQFSSFMDKVFSVLVKYRKQVDFDVKSSFSEEARKYKIGSKGLVVNGTEIFPEHFNSSKLEAAIKRALEASESVVEAQKT
ncbi:MAG: hypothetical protein ACTSP1_16540 [Candidatus Freyarchaeota archaeon]|nr:hypothetical protein [Candidatus Freyarchaeota archaeon]